MSQRLFISALFLSVFLSLFCCTTCEPSDGAAADAQSIEIFSSGKTKVTGASGSGGGEIKFTNFYLPSLVATDNALVAVTAGLRDSEDFISNNLDILTKYIETKKEDRVTTFTNAESWKTESAQQRLVRGDKTARILSAATNENKIYILLVNDSVQLEKPKTGGDQKWEFVLVEGEVKPGQENSQNIKWYITSLTDVFENSSFKNELLKSHPQVFSSLVTTEGKVVFFVSGGIQQNSKKIFAIIKSNNSEQNLRVLLVNDISNDCNLHFILWGNKVIMIPNNCKGNQKIQKFDYINEEFKKNNESAGRVWEFLKDKNDITTAGINGTPAVLFTQEKINGGKKDIHLWVTDGNRSANVGVVFNKVKDGFQRSFVCTENRLFSLHQKDDESNGKNYNITHFEGQMENITSLLRSWKESNDKFTELCKETDKKQTACSTDGLVGFLSNTSNDKKEWKDEYLYVDATVTGGRKVKNGFRFNGRNAGATWPVGKTAEGDQPYDFRDSGLTLVATVWTGSDGKNNSILGFAIEKENIKKNIGLWCTGEGRWGLSDGNSATKKNGGNCEKEKAYLVALTMKDTDVTIYIDGEKVEKLSIKAIDVKQQEDIKYFYFGANVNEQELQSTTSTAGDVSDVTVTNVLLYNRPFDADEIKNLKENMKPVEVKKKDKRNSGSQNSNESTTQNDSSQPDTSTTKNKTKDKQSSSPPPTTEDSAARVGVVGVLCFMLFGVFTLLGRYVC